MLLFHHAHGRTKGFLAFADELRDAGHTVHTPDLYEGNTFEDLEEGVGYARQVGFDEIMRRGAEAAEELPDELVFAGFSVLYLKEAITWNHAVGFALIAAGAFFVFRGPL